MQKTELKYVFVTIVCILSSCTVSPVDIVYDYDQCHACKMTISDSRFGCEIVTKKAKVYKYDAIECLIQELTEFKKDELTYILVTDFKRPEKLFDARTATYIKSPDRPSPMGAFLSAYTGREKAIMEAEGIQGKLYSWEELNNEIK